MELALEGFHHEGFLLGGADVGAVAATGAVHSADLHTEAHTGQFLGHLHVDGLHRLGGFLSASAKMDTSAIPNIAYGMPFICRGDCHFHLSLRLQKYNFSPIWPNFSSSVDNSHIISP